MVEINRMIAQIIEHGRLYYQLPKFQMLEFGDLALETKEVGPNGAAL